MNGSTNGTLTNDPDSKEILILNAINLYVNDVLGSIIFTLGVLFNILSFIYFQLSQSFRDTSMRYYLSVLSITDSLRLSEWFFLFLLNKKIIFLNKPICSSFLYTTMTSGNISVWLLVFLSIERFVILRFPFKGIKHWQAIFSPEYWIWPSEPDIQPKKKLHIGSGSWVTPRPKTKINLGLESKHKLILIKMYRNQQTFKIVDTQKFADFFLRILKKIF